MARTVKRAALLLLFLAITNSFALAGELVGPGNFKESLNDVRVVFIDVWQGDSILVTAPLGRNILIDAGGELADGGNAGAGKVVPFLKKLGVESLDYLILTHPHPDHAGGMISVIENIKVKNYRDTGLNSDEVDMESIRKAVRTKGINYSVLRRGDRFESGPGMSFEVLAPGNNRKYKKENDGSLVIKFNYLNTSVMLAGDAEMEEEDWILRQGGGTIACDVLKAPHHGSYSSSSAAFLNAVAPRAAVISCGSGNPYGHPHSTTLAKYKKRNIEIYRTDRGGDITMTSNGSEFKLETEK